MVLGPRTIPGAKSSTCTPETRFVVADRRSAATFLSFLRGCFNTWSGKGNEAPLRKKFLCGFILAPLLAPYDWTLQRSQQAIRLTLGRFVVKDVRLCPIPAIIGSLARARSRSAIVDLLPNSDTSCLIASAKQYRAS